MCNNCSDYYYCNYCCIFYYNCNAGCGCRTYGNCKKCGRCSNCCNCGNYCNCENCYANHMRKERKKRRIRAKQCGCGNC